MALPLQSAIAMKKSTTHKLSLRSHTIRLLTDASLDRIVGGNLEPIADGFIMKDTIIVRTGVR